MGLSKLGEYYTISRVNCKFSRENPTLSTKTAEDILVSTVISGHHHLTLLTVTMDFVMAIAILAMLKILID